MYKAISGQGDAPSALAKPFEAGSCAASFAPLHCCAWTLVLILCSFLLDHCRFTERKEHPATAQEFNCTGKWINARQQSFHRWCSAAPSPGWGLRQHQIMCSPWPLEIRISSSRTFLKRCAHRNLHCRRVHRWSRAAQPAVMPSCCESFLRSRPRNSRELHPVRKQRLTLRPYRSLSRHSDAAAVAAYEPGCGRWPLLEQSDLRIHYRTANVQNEH